MAVLAWLCALFLPLRHGHLPSGMARRPQRRCRAVGQHTFGLVGTCVELFACGIHPMTRQKWRVGSGLTPRFVLCPNIAGTRRMSSESISTQERLRLRPAICRFAY
eukprot:249922-Chlamydomonas_euryale.AAC.1